MPEGPTTATALGPDQSPQIVAEGGRRLPRRQTAPELLAERLQTGERLPAAETLGEVRVPPPALRLPRSPSA